MSLYDLWLEAKTSKDDGLKAKAFIAAYDNDRSIFCFDELCEGASALFYSDQNERVAELLADMIEYTRNMSI